MNALYSPWVCIWCGEELDLEDCDSVEDNVYCSGCGGVVGTDYTVELVVAQKAA